MMKTLRVVDDGDHDERVEEREESAWSELECSTRRERPCGAIGALTGLTLTLSESEVSWGEVSEEDIIPLTR